MSSLVSRVRCLLTGHTPTTTTYKSIATSAGLHLHPECCKDGWIQMRETKCAECGVTIYCYPVEYAED